AGWVAHRRLVWPSVAALGSFLAAALVIGRPLHISFAALALAAALVATAETLRGEHVPAAPWRDYVTLTKPRVKTLLLPTGVGAPDRCMRDGCRGKWTSVGVALRRHDARPRPRLRRRERAEPRHRPRHRPAHASYRPPPRRGRPCGSDPGARVRRRVVGAFLR